MYKVIVTHGTVSIDFPFTEKTQAHEMYLKQVAHYAKDCALMADRCIVRLKEQDMTIAKTSIESSKRSN